MDFLYTVQYFSNPVISVVTAIAIVLMIYHSDIKNKNVKALCATVVMLTFGMIVGWQVNYYQTTPKQELIKEQKQMQEMPIGVHYHC